MPDPNLASALRKLNSISKKNEKDELEEIKTGLEETKESVSEISTVLGSALTHITGRLDELNRRIDLMDRTGTMGGEKGGTNVTVKAKDVGAIQTGDDASADTKQ